jgi:uncharacterized protein with PIN domain
MSRPVEVRFLCDAMLGGLARWLRAAGYDAQFEYGIADRDLLRLAQATGRILLSSDGPLFERNIIKDALLKALYIPQQLDKIAQLRFVLKELHLPLGPSRCMACGGELLSVPKHEVMGEAPPLAYRNCQEFFRCRTCLKLFWQGTHWQKITRKLEEVARASRP